MAIAEDIHARCRLCTEKAASMLADMITGDRIDPVTVQARRTAADIAGVTTYALLNRAFITPIDREDLWLMWETSERLCREAEDTALILYHGGRELPSVCKTMIRATVACCEATGKITDLFPSLDTAVQQFRLLREAQHTCHVTIHNCFADATVRQVCESAYRVIGACEQLIHVLRYAALKNG